MTLDDRLFSKAQQFIKNINAEVKAAPHSYDITMPVMFRGLDRPSYITAHGTSLVKAVLRLNVMLDTLRKIQDFRSLSQRNFWRSFYHHLDSTTKGPKQ